MARPGFFSPILGFRKTWSVAPGGPTTRLYVLWRARDGERTAERAHGLARRLRRLRYAERRGRGGGLGLWTLRY